MNKQSTRDHKHPRSTVPIKISNIIGHASHEDNKHSLYLRDKGRWRVLY